MCIMQDFSAAEPADNASRPPVHHKAKSARRSSKPLRTEWSIMALTTSGSSSEPQKEFGTQSLSAAGLSAAGVGSAAEASGEVLCEEAQGASSAQHDACASVSAHDRGGEPSDASLQREQRSSHAASTAQISSSMRRDCMPSSSTAHHTSQQQSEHVGNSNTRTQGLPDQEAFAGQLQGRSEDAWRTEERGRSTEEHPLPSSSPSRAQPPTACVTASQLSVAVAQQAHARSTQPRASMALPQEACAGSVPYRPTTLDLEGDRGGLDIARMEGSLPSSRQAPVHSPLQHSSHSSTSPGKKPSTSHFSIHADSRAHVHRYGMKAAAHSNSTVANKSISPKVCILGSALIASLRCQTVCMIEACADSASDMQVLSARVRQ